MIDFEQAMQILTSSIEVTLWIYVGTIAAFVAVLVFITDQYFKLSRKYIRILIDDVHSNVEILNVYTKTGSVYFEWQQDLLTDEQAMRRIAEIYVNGNRKYLRARMDTWRERDEGSDDGRKDVL